MSSDFVQRMELKDQIDFFFPSPDPSTQDSAVCKAEDLGEEEMVAVPPNTEPRVSFLSLLLLLQWKLSY